ncbi:MAG: hypothetical protein KC912_10180 [Proteobacteria bacterium]|nr:hypothetical protein [Pseudomonadota bacterium]
MNPIYTVETASVVHHIDLRKIADVRHEPRANRASVFFAAGGETIVMFRDAAALAQFVASFKAINAG